MCSYYFQWNPSFGLSPEQLSIHVAAAADAAALFHCCSHHHVCRREKRESHPGHRISTCQRPNAGKICKWLIRFELAIWLVVKKVHFALLKSVMWLHLINDWSPSTDATLFLCKHPHLFCCGPDAGEGQCDIETSHTGISRLLCYHELPCDGRAGVSPVHAGSPM